MHAPAEPLTDNDVRAVKLDLDRLCAAIGQRLLGKELAIREVVAALIAGGHILIEDVPGVGKTTLAIALARAIDGLHHRIQFTSDLLPSDVIGVPLYNQKENSFEFRPGPIFANIVLADEINRTTPKTQSAMLEAMQDGSVSIDREVHRLPRPFMVIATQNPIEHHGTYPLPESQLDRFMLRIRIGYPDAACEAEVLLSPGIHDDNRQMPPVLNLARVLELQRAAGRVRVDRTLVDYILRIVTATREHEDISLGVSTRGSMMIFRAAQAWALLDGRAYCVPDDIKTLTHTVLAHRLILRAGVERSLTHGDLRESTTLLLDAILGRIEVPR